MKYSYIFALFVVVILSQTASAKDTDVDALRMSKLKHYDFQRTTANYEDVQLLLGNAEMGGTARQDGLGFDRIWFSDFWRTASARMPVYGPKLEVADTDALDAYSQTLELSNGMLTTAVKRGAVSYKSEIFFSEADKNLLVIRLSDLSPQARKSLKLHAPIFDVSGRKGDRSNVVQSTTDRVFIIKQRSPHCLLGSSIDEMMAIPKLMYKTEELYPVSHKMIYGITCSAKLEETEEAGVYSVDCGDEPEVLLIFTQSTNYDGGNLEDNVLNQLRGKTEYRLLSKANTAAWLNNWQRMAVIELPDKRHEQLWYRSQYWLFATSASEKFLPGESQFGCEGWDMLPFTFGGAGWGIHNFVMLGYPEKALLMLKQHNLPEAQNRNALHWLNHAEEERKASGMTQPSPYPQNPHSEIARCFAHEMQTSGDCTLLTWGNQAHLQGFALELYQRYYNYYPSEEFLCKELYPVAKGIAEYWANFLIWDHNAKEYYTPKTWGASEGGMHNNPLDAVLAAKKCLRAAAKYARMLEVDKDMAEKWEFMDKNIQLPRNENGYVAYRGHDGAIPEDGSGYNGIRYMNAANFVNQELLHELDAENVSDLLGRISKSNRFGTGFAVFHSAQTATAECLFGRGDSALGYLNGVLRAYDPSGTCLRECEDRPMIYFLTNTDAYLLAPLFMMMQTSGGRIKPFPAMPSSWKNAAFYNLPAEGGIKVSGKMENGKVKWVRFFKNGKMVKETNQLKEVKVADL